MPILKPPITVNSSSYVDVAGIALGLDRLVGETSPEYLERLREAVVYERSHSYEGALARVNLELAFPIGNYISITSQDATASVRCSVAGVDLITTAGTTTIPVVTMDRDDVWVWSSLSQVAAGINAVSGFAATLKVDDGPALQLARQTNAIYAVNEPITRKISTLTHGGVIRGSEVFNLPVSSYQLAADGGLSFTSDIPDQLLISYKYISWPYQLVGSPVAMIGLSDPETGSVAVSERSAVAYQLRESIYSIADRDRSYWAR